MKEKSEKNGKRDQVLVVKITAEEKARVMKYTRDRSVNMSALVRKLLFEHMDD